ncbi:MAG: glycosyltransferase family 9 protein [Opitutales bacterium]
MSKRKTLAIKFKYLGDVAIMVPALRALRAAHPDDEIHVLVADDAQAILRNLDWIDRVWPLPRARGKWKVARSLRLIRELRQQRFDRSVDFVGNDRGAWLSRLIGAKERLGVRPAKGFRWRRLLYKQTIEELDTTRHETVRDWFVLKPWGIAAPTNWSLETQPDKQLFEAALGTLPAGSVVAHLSTSQRKKEWPVARWAEVWAHHRERFPQTPLLFSSGPSPREQQLLEDLRRVDPTIELFPPQPDLEHFLAMLGHAAAFISGDTAPLHLAAGLGLPTVGLFGPTSAERWAPIGSAHQILRGSLCACSGHLSDCAAATRCIDAITPQQVMDALARILEYAPVATR